MTRNYPTYGRNLTTSFNTFDWTDANDIFFLVATNTTDSKNYMYVYRGNDPTSSSLLYQSEDVKVDLITVASDGPGYTQAFVVSNGKVEVWEVFD